MVSRTSRKPLSLMAWILVLLLAAIVRFQLAWRFPCCVTGDTKVYVRLAENILDYRTYSLDPTPPHSATSIRMPGYPIFLAAVYSLQRSNDLVRVVQALIDTATIVLVAILAMHWVPAERQKPTAALAALVLMALCPVTAIFVGALLTETLFTFLLVATALAATLAVKAPRYRSWAMFAAGLLCGIATLVRPEGGLLGAGVGVVFGLTTARLFEDQPVGATRFAEPRAILQLAAFCLAFGMSVGPWVTWTLLNSKWPLPSPHTVLPDGVVPYGYYAWLRTWVKDDRQTDALIWALGSRAIMISEIPDDAFDSQDERARVASLLHRHNESSTYRGKERASPFSASLTAAGIARLNMPDDASADNPILWTMSPFEDAEFEKLARERITRHPLRYYLWLPARRVSEMWLNSHTDYYRLDLGLWVRAFHALVAVYTTLALIGAYKLIVSRSKGLRWFVLVSLLAVPRLLLISMLENPEPRYVVPLFPLAIALGGVAIASLRCRTGTPR